MKRSGIAMLLALITVYSCNKRSDADAALKPISYCEVESVNMYVPPLAAEAEYASVASDGKKEITTAHPAPNKPGVKVGIDTVIKKKIIKDGDISVETEDVNVCKKMIDEELKKLNAYYEAEDLRNLPERISVNLKIRVPSENFEKLVANIENGKGQVRNKSIRARDVTEEYLDIETRLKNKKEYLKRYKELLSRAKTVEDILQIEENIRALQEEIESKEGRLKYLNDQVAYSTLDLFIFRKKVVTTDPVEEEKFSKKVKDSLGYGWTAIVNFVLRIISGWPVVLSVFLFACLIKRLVKKRKKQKSDN